jgi:ribokinase
VLGPRLGPHGADPLAWDGLDGTDAVYLTAGDVEAVRHARRARVLVATPRGLETLSRAHVELDALVSSGRDPGELYRLGDLDPVPRVVVRTLGASGGEWETASGERGKWGPAPLPGPIRDAYGAGDSFAAGLTYGLGAGWEIATAVELAARCGAACMTGRGPYEAQLTL